MLREMRKLTILQETIVLFIMCSIAVILKLIWTSINPVATLSAEFAKMCISFNFDYEVTIFTLKSWASLKIYRF